MSNPFAIFRKNQKTWMAGLVLLAILAFVVAPAIQTATSAFTGAGSAGKEVVVSWTGGNKITIGDLQNSAAQHSALVRFLGALAEKVMEKGGMPQVPNFQVDPASGQVLSVGIPGGSNEVDICRNRILASYGNRIGIVLSDETADEFIREFCDEKIATEEMLEILSEASGGRLTWFEVRELLKEQLTSMVVGQTATAGLGANSPGKMFRDFEKLNLTAKVEAYPVFVGEFLTEIKDSPTEADINAIYEIGSTRVADANSPEAGFMRRYQANIEYIEGNSDVLLENAKNTITEEEIKAEYDLQISLGSPSIKIAVEDEANSPSDESGSPDGAENPEGGSTEEAATGTEEAPAEAAGASEGGDTGAAEEPASSAPAAGDQGSMLDNQVRLVSYVQESGGNTPPPVVSPPQLSNTPAESGADGNSAGGDGELQLSDPTDPNGADTSADEEIATAVPTEPEMRDKTFEEARDELLETLARRKANEERQAKFKEILEEMQKFSGEMRQYQAFVEADLLEDENGDPRVPPERPDLKKMAEDAGFVLNETGLMDGTKLAQLPIGRAFVGSSFSGNSSVANVMMNPGVGVFQPLEALFLDQTAFASGSTPPLINYLCWKSEEKGAYIPELDEVRGEVEDAWKRQKARELALTQATDLSKKVVGNSEDPWAGALDLNLRNLVREPEPFTWMQYFNQRSFISSVPALNGEDNTVVGGEFMQQVFSAQPGQVVVAANSNKSIYYVTRIVEFSPSSEELRDRFNADPMKSGPVNIAVQEENRLVIDWYENLELELGVQWQMNVGQFN